LHKYGTARLQPFHYISIVDNLMEYVYWRTVQLESAFHDLDRSHYAGAKASRLRQNDFHHRFLSSLGPSSMPRACAGAR
jgi:hypothetical protein